MLAQINTGKITYGRLGSGVNGTRPPPSDSSATTASTSQYAAASQREATTPGCARVCQVNKNGVVSNTPSASPARHVYQAVA
jgi:hypothetical protein